MNNLIHAPLAAVVMAATLLSCETDVWGNESEPVLISEGRIVSVDAMGSVIVLRARIERKDTFAVGNASVTSPGQKLSTVKDLAPGSPVRVKYAPVKGIKLAAEIVAMPKPWQETPPAIVQGDNMVVAEGTIRSIDDAGNTMIITASTEREDTFALDKSAVIRAGNRMSTLGELRNFVSVNVRYTLQNGKRIVNAIIGTITGNGSEKTAGQAR